MMKAIYIQSFKIGNNTAIPFRITIMIKDDVDFKTLFFLLRPSKTIRVKMYEDYGLDRLAILAAPPFCDIADELIELLEDQELVFLNPKQYLLLKGQFRTIGYNFNLKPKYLYKKSNKIEDLENVILSGNLQIDNINTTEFSEAICHFMLAPNFEVAFNSREYLIQEGIAPEKFNLSQYQLNPGVYYFLNDQEDVIYVGKAKNVRKRLQSHFGNKSKLNNINYSEVTKIEVEYSGNDIIAQLIETENIKMLMPIHNTQQIKTTQPYIISTVKTALGISKIKISRKETADSLPERYYNRESVVKALNIFCERNSLCRKHCGIERIKGPCSVVTIKNRPCVCSGEEEIKLYNVRFDYALKKFINKATEVFYKLKGRDETEDAFIYEVNNVYQGYGFINKLVNIQNFNDIIGNINLQENNYETARIIDFMKKKIHKKNIIELNI